jgi:hypothetical protein
MSESKETNMTNTDDKPDVLEAVYWVREVTDPVQRFVEATRLGDEARGSLLPELAAVRRQAAHEARRALIAGGMNATEATREVARQAHSTPQTIGRMISERSAYGIPEESAA